MKTKCLNIIIILLLSLVTLKAQTYQKGDVIGNFTIGLGNALYTGLGYTSAVPPIAISGEYIVADHLIDKGSIGVGGLLGYASVTYSYAYYTFSESWKYSSIVIGPGGAFHYPFTDKLEGYAGVLLCFNIVSGTYTSNDYGYVGTTGGAASNFIFVGFFGARYYFTNKVAVLAQLGSGFAYFNIGLTVKLK